jgi:peptidoglycan/LPS O-acetylase OafA/YrhL
MKVLFDRISRWPGSSQIDRHGKNMTESPLNPANQQIFTVEALRGVAALAVTWFHMTNTYSLDWVRYSGFNGWLGVDMFFVISGFIIPYSLHRSKYKLAYFPRFLLRRLVRLEPPYLISIAVVLILWELAARTPGFAGSPPTYSIGQVLAHFLYLIPLTNYPWLNIVYWTLAYEFVFYILAGLLWPVLSHRSLLFTAALVACIQAIDIALLREHVTGAALLFFVGICCARKRLKLDPPWLSLSAAVIAVVALWWIVEPMVALVSFGTAFFIAFVDIPRLRVLGFLGAISYSLYLLHVPIGGRVVNIGRRFVDGPVQEFFLSLVALAVSLLVATIFWKYVEEPAKRASKRVALSPPFARVASPSTPR